MDLRHYGWELVHRNTAAVGAVAVIDAARLEDDALRPIMLAAGQDARRSMLVYGVNSPEHRARLLAFGYGDVVSDDVLSIEFAARARRISDLGSWVPRSRSLATLELDLLAREATYEGRPVRLHPREFGMLWRLADTPDEAVSKQTLLADVWRLGFAPESNSLAVQISRMRSKLAAVGLADLIETVSGGYRMSLSCLPPHARFPRWDRSHPDPRNA